MNLFVSEYKRYKSLLEGAIEQVPEELFFEKLDGQDNSIAIIVNHISGNLKSRFTDFLTSDGEKEWRKRDTEFTVENATKSELIQNWNEAWQVLEDSVFGLGAEDMKKTVTIRGVEFTVEEALVRSVAHLSYHVGQITFLAKHFAGKKWNYLSIAPGKTEEYNKNPTREK